MLNNIIIYENAGKDIKKAAESFALILGSAKVFKLNNIPKNINFYDNVIFLFSLDNDETAIKISDILNNLPEEKFIVLSGIGFNKNVFKTYCDAVLQNISKSPDYIKFILKNSNSDICNSALEIKNEIEKQYKKADDEVLKNH